MTEKNEEERKGKENGKIIEKKKGKRRKIENELFAFRNYDSQII
jgi:hypothetical protein